MKNDTGYINTAAMADIVKLPKNSSKSDEWNRANRKYKSNIINIVKLSMPNFTWRCTVTSGFIYDLFLNQTNKYIYMILDIEKYSGRTYETEVRKGNKWAGEKFESVSQ